MNTTLSGAATWIATWIIFILIFALLAKSGWGKPIVYYGLWMLVLILVVTHAKELASLVNPQALQLNG